VPDAVVPAIVIMAVAQVVLANVVQPRITGNAVGLSPFAVLVAVLIGGNVAGVLGAIFSVPVAAAAVAIAHRLAAAEPDSWAGEREPTDGRDPGGSAQSASESVSAENNF
jgi:predicted PurR-regulated permease PerM